MYCDSLGRGSDAYLDSLCRGNFVLILYVGEFCVLILYDEEVCLPSFFK